MKPSVSLIINAGHFCNFTNLSTVVPQIPMVTAKVLHLYSIRGICALKIQTSNGQSSKRFFKTCESKKCILKFINCADEG